VDEAKVIEVLAAANRAVDAAKVPADLRPAAFAKAVDLLAGGGGSDPLSGGRTARPRSRSRQQAKNPAPKAPGAGVTTFVGTGSLDAAAETLKIDRATLDAVIGIESGQPIVHVKPSELEKNARPAMRQLILILTGVRQAGGWDEQTDGALLQKQLSTHHKGHYDSNNFWNAVGGVSDSIRNTAGKLKVIPAGYTAAAAVITALAGGGGDKKKSDGKKKSDN
jgi:hypothetical protein